MSIAQRFLVKIEQLPECIYGKMALSVFLLVNDCRRESLFVGLSLEYFFFDRAGRNETVNKTFTIDLIE
jgi:hypothetical protein